jgi:preprotein translocase subunit SecY
MKKFAAIFKNKELVNRIFFTVMVLFVLRIGAQIYVPGVSVNQDKLNELTNSGSTLALMDLLGGGALSNFSVFALGVSPYITAQIIIQLLSKDVLPALTELSKQGEYGRKKIEMATRYLTLLLGAVQGYGIIKTMENSDYISITLKTTGGAAFWSYAYIVTILLAGAMLTMWLGDQITEKGIGNGISVIIFAGCVRSLPTQIKNAWVKWISNNTQQASSQMVRGSFQFALYILALVFITGFVVFVELSKRKIPVQHANKGGGQSMARASFLPIKVNSAGVIPVIFASSIMSAPAVVASFISSDAANAEWLKIFNYNQTFTMPWFNGATWKMDWGLVIYLALIIAFTFFYSEMEIDPEQLADNFQKNGSYIPGIRPGKETERYVGKVLNRVTFIGAMALAAISALPIILVISNAFDGDSSLSMGGTGLIIVVGVALEINSQIDGLLAGKSFEEVQEGI